MNKNKFQMPFERKKRYDWSHFLNDESSSDEECDSDSSEWETFQQDPPSSGTRWMAEQVPKVPPLSLMDKCARSLAQYWTENDMVAQQVDSLPVTFCVQVGLFLQGLALCMLIETSGGLYEMASGCFVHLFQSFLVHVINQSQRFDESRDITQRLYNLVSNYGNDIIQKGQLDYTLHSLGLTHKFRQNWLYSDVDQEIQLYYLVLHNRFCHTRHNKILKLIYPLPHVLRPDPFKTNLLVLLHFPLSPERQRLHQAKLEHHTVEEIQNELQGLALTPLLFTAEENQVATEKNSARRHLSCLKAMVRSQFMVASHCTLVLAFLALVEPYYMAGPVMLESNDAFLSKRHDFKIDIFWFISQALSDFYAELDLPWACLWMAKKVMGKSLALSDQMRHAIMVQSVLVQYGHWSSASSLFYEWFHRMPCLSWMYEELVLLHAKCVFSQVEDGLIEVWITKQYHARCSARCHHKFVHKALRKMQRQIEEMHRIALHCMTKNMTDNFKSELCLVVQLCLLYKINIGLLFRHPDLHTSNVKEKLHNIWRNMKWDTYDYTSAHLQPFVHQLVLQIDTEYHWEHQMRMIREDKRKMVQESTGIMTSRFIANHFYSLVVCMLHHISPDPFYFSFVLETIQEYELYTAGRHYRIPLLQQLYQVMRSPNEYSLTSRVRVLDCFSSSTRHVGLSWDKLSAVGLTRNNIDQFSFTLQDAKDDFAHVLSNDEAFIQYLKERDPMMTVWLDIGLRTLCLDREI